MLLGIYCIGNPNDREARHGLDDFCYEQIHAFQKLNEKQISSLIKIDVNYILPYITVWNDIEKQAFRNVFSKEERNNSQVKCENIFKELYGSEMLEKYRECINLIYDMQINKQDQLSERMDTAINTQTADKSIVKKFLENREIPLEEFKLLFNEQILNNNTPESIKKYLQEKAQGNEATEEFQNIIKNAYGKRAEGILKSRPNLNVHSINSLEVFDERILEQYGEAFVHDCISYNLWDFSAFLSVIKDQEKSEDFKSYYSALSEIYGENVETMQKAMREFHSVEELFKNSREVELTDKQYSNLISVICARKNPNKITTLSELQNYNKIVNQQLEEMIISPDTQSKDLKAMICNQILGIDDRSYEDYGRDLEFISELYDIQSETTRENVYSKNEQDILKVIDFIAKEGNIEKMKEFAREAIRINENGIQIPIDLQSALSKTAEHQVEILNQSLTSLEEIRRIARETGNSKEGKAYIENYKGVECYHLNGIDYSFLATNTGSLFDNEFTQSYEGRAGNNAICCRLVSSRNKSKLTEDSGRHLYFNISPNMVIAADNKDAGTQHIAKRVKNRGNIRTKITEIPEKLDYYGNEVAINRRFQNHKNVTNENRGGRVIPDAYEIISEHTLTEEEIEFCQKYKVPVFVIHRDAYRKEEQKQNEENNKER